MAGKRRPLIEAAIMLMLIILSNFAVKETVGRQVTDAVKAPSASVLDVKASKYDYTDFLSSNTLLTLVGYTIKRNVNKCHFLQVI